LALQGMIPADRVPQLLAKIEQLIGVDDL
jgi:hypothetical protein